MKKYLTLITLFIAVFALSGTQVKADFSIDYTCSKNYQGATLNFLNWGEYMDRDLVKEFEKLCNAKVIYEEADSSETMRTRITSGATNYDLLTPSDYMVQNLINNNLLATLNKDNIPNLVHIDKDNYNLPFDTNNNYSIPYFWGTVGIMYNLDLLAELGIKESEMNSWDILWDERLDNNIYMYESQRDLFMVALKALGYSVNPQEGESVESFKEKIDEAKALLAEQFPLVRSYLTDTIKKGVVNGDAAVGMVFSGDYLDMLFELTEAGDEINIGYVVPKEGSNLWVDNFVIPKNSDNKELAEEFINFFLDPKVAYYNAAWVGYSTPHKEAYKQLLEDEDYKDLVTTDAYMPSQATLSRTEVYEDLGQELSEYLSDAYISFKSEDSFSIGQIIGIVFAVVAVGGFVGFRVYKKKKHNQDI
jgi:spermidine/putrescine transport system substrate-binding protein